MYEKELSWDETGSFQNTFCAVRNIVVPTAQSPMHHTKTIWGILLFVLIIVSPLPASAQSPDNKPPIPTGNFSAYSSQAQTYTFAEIWAWIVEAQRIRPSHFSPELVACLMWEESGFRLVENPQSHALGFGQVMPSTLNAVNRRFKTNFTRTVVLTSPEVSVQVTLLALEVAYEWKKDKVRALVAYAGGMQNYRVVNKWLVAEPKMIQVRWSETSMVSALPPDASSEMIAAMKICSQPGFDPQHTF